MLINIASHQLGALHRYYQPRASRNASSSLFPNFIMNLIFLLLILKNLKHGIQFESSNESINTCIYPIYKTREHLEWTGPNTIYNSK